MMLNRKRRKRRSVVIELNMHFISQYLYNHSLAQRYLQSLPALNLHYKNNLFNRIQYLQTNFLPLPLHINSNQIILSFRFPNQTIISLILLHYSLNFLSYLFGYLHCMFLIIDYNLFGVNTIFYNFQLLEYAPDFVVVLALKEMLAGQQKYQEVMESIAAGVIAQNFVVGLKELNSQFLWVFSGQIVYRVLQFVTEVDSTMAVGLEKNRQLKLHSFCNHIKHTDWSYKQLLLTQLLFDSIIQGLVDNNNRPNLLPHTLTQLLIYIRLHIHNYLPNGQIIQHSHIIPIDTFQNALEFDQNTISISIEKYTEISL